MTAASVRQYLRRMLLGMMLLALSAFGGALLAGLVVGGLLGLLGPFLAIPSESDGIIWLILILGALWGQARYMDEIHNAMDS